MTIHYFDPVERSAMERALHGLDAIADGKYPERIFEGIESEYHYAARVGHASAIAKEAAGVLRALLRPAINRDFPDPTEPSHVCRRGRSDDGCLICGEVTTR